MHYTSGAPLLDLPTTIVLAFHQTYSPTEIERLPIVTEASCSLLDGPVILHNLVSGALVEVSPHSLVSGGSHLKSDHIFDSSTTYIRHPASCAFCRSREYSVTDFILDMAGRWIHTPSQLDRLPWTGQFQIFSVPFQGNTAFMWGRMALNWCTSPASS
jgi:hypothetical protein